MGTYLLITPREDELYHYGVRGMKWHQHKGLGNSSGVATTGMGGGSVEISEEEREIQKNELAAENLDRLASAMERRGRNVFHVLVVRRGSAEAKRRAEVGKRKLQQIKEYLKKTGASFQQSDDQDGLIFALDYTPDDLMHFGIKGMKWGIRRFQPYQKGEKVKGGKEVGAATKVKQRPSSGNIIERYKAHKVKQKRVAALKKAQATRKANADFEAEKKKAIESGSIEDLAKFKGKLTNEEYNRAFMRLQNEQKVAALVQANQKTVWDKVDKGMEIVARVSKYASIATTAKNNFDALDEALHKKEREAEKDKKTAEKNKFLTNIDNITELNEGVEKHKITPQEYQAAMNILANKKINRARFAGMGEGGDFEDQNKKAAKEKAERDRADRAKWTAEQNWKQYQKRKEKEAKRKEKEEKGRPMDGTWREDNPSSAASSSTASSPTPTSSLGTGSGSGSGSGSTSSTSSPNSAMNSARAASSASAYARNAANRSANSKGTKSGKATVDKYYDTRMSNVRATYSNEGAKSAYTATKTKFAKEKADQEAKDRAMIQRVLAKSREASSSSKRSISGAKSAGSNTTYKQQYNFDFGDVRYRKLSAKSSTPSKVVTDTRQTVANTQAEAARQRELDKKRKKSLGHSAIDGSDELYHHGIKGQKWGVRRFQDKNGRRTAAGKERVKYLRDRVKASRGGIVDDTWKTGSAALVARTDSDIEQLTKRYVGGVPHYASPSIVMRDFLRDTGDAPPDYKPTKAITSFEEADLGYVNPEWGQPGTTQNCAKCAVAVELMRYGVAVRAGRQAFPSSASAMSYWFDGTERVAKSVDETEKLLASYGDGASGTIAGYYPNGAGGHAMHFSVKHGRVYVQDGQNGRHFGSVREAAEAYGFDMSREMHSYRLDTATPNWEHMAEDSVIGAPRWQKDDDRWRAKSSAPFRFTNNSDGTISNYDLTPESSDEIFRRHYNR